MSCPSSVKQIGIGLNEYFGFDSNSEMGGNSNKLGSKLKGVLRSAIDGAPLDEMSAQSAWDAFGDESPVN